MSDYNIQYFSTSDNCTYCWDETNNKWLKVCPVDTVPDDVKLQVLKTREWLAKVKV